MMLLKSEVSFNREANEAQIQLELLQPPLVHAILSGNLEEVEQILDETLDAAASLDSEKRTPLHAAAFAGYAEVAEVLITKGSARVDAKDNQWLTPLHRACRSVTDQTGKVMRISRDAGFDDDIGVATQTRPDQVVMHGTGGQQCMHR